MPSFGKLFAVVFAAAAVGVNAHAHGHAAHHHVRRGYGNETDVFSHSPAALTTSTVFQTQTFTVISCAPSVKDCPAESTATITSVVAVATVTVPNIATGNGFVPSSVAAPVGTGSASAAGATRASAGLSAAPVNGSSSSSPTATTIVSNSTLTYTLGSGSSATVVTTTIQRTSTEYLTKTVYATLSSASSAAGSTGAALNTTGSALNATGSALNATSSSTTTIKSTSTLTNFVTVYPVASSTSGVSVAGSGSSGSNSSSSASVSASVSGSSNAATSASVQSPNGGTNGSCGALPTVTVTQKETVYITVDPASATAGSSIKTSFVTVLPLQSSPAPYYPTTVVGAASASGAADSTGRVLSTGFVTLHAQSTGSPIADPAATSSDSPTFHHQRPSGWWPMASASASPSGYWGSW
ncbi:hypothetical protein LTR28_003911 [Elasticomyces elasticus]|nr:hypothetical protein LTR28_003911 [Elasticomyces elasticus]